MDIFLSVGMDEQDLAENFTGCWNSQLRVHMIAQDLAGKISLRGLSNPIKYWGAMGMILGQTPTNIT